MMVGLVKFILYAIAAVFIVRYLKNLRRQYLKSYKKEPIEVTLDKPPHEILEVELTADLNEIRKAYHRQIIKYHPDKVSHLGKEIQSVARRKTAQINMAYEEMTKGFNQ